MAHRQPRRVIIAGGSGFIGRALASKLAERGDDVVILTPCAPRRLLDEGMAFQFTELSSALMSSAATNQRRHPAGNAFLATVGEELIGVAESAAIADVDLIRWNPGTLKLQCDRRA